MHSGKSYYRTLVKLFLLTFLLTPIHYGCATDQAQKLRAERPVSIGSDLSLSVLGGEYRPKTKQDIGLDFAISRVPHGASYLDFSNPRNLFIDFLDDAIRDAKASGITVDGGVSWFPFPTSAFRTGAHLSIEQAHIEFNATLKDTSSKAAAPRVSYDRQAVYLGLPLGWHWIWSNGITWGLDFGPRIRIYGQKSLQDDGGPTVDTADRDQYIQKSEERRRLLVGGLITYLGYSF